MQQYIAFAICSLVIVSVTAAPGSIDKVLLKDEQSTCLSAAERASIKQSLRLLPHDNLLLLAEQLSFKQACSVKDKNTNNVGDDKTTNDKMTITVPDLGVNLGNWREQLWQAFKNKLKSL